MMLEKKLILAKADHLEAVKFHPTSQALKRVARSPILTAFRLASQPIMNASLSRSLTRLMVVK